MCRFAWSEFVSHMFPLSENEELKMMLSVVAA
jgi:hypothetical protein